MYSSPSIPHIVTWDRSPSSCPGQKLSSILESSLARTLYILFVGEGTCHLCLQHIPNMPPSPPCQCRLPSPPSSPLSGCSAPALVSPHPQLQSICHTTMAILFKQNCPVPPNPQGSSEEIPDVFLYLTRPRVIWLPPTSFPPLPTLSCSLLLRPHWTNLGSWTTRSRRLPYILSDWNPLSTHIFAWPALII